MKMRHGICLILAIGFGFPALGQQPSSSDKDNNLSEQNPLTVDVATNSSGVIQLQDTIRASREQPKVLSIVPWQPPAQKASLPSPIVKRIEQNFKPLSRAEFMRQLEHFEQVSK